VNGESIVVSATDRATIWILQTVGRARWGFRPDLVSDLVAQLGSASTISWFAANVPAYEQIKKDWGPLRTHLVTSVISMLEGCPYNAYGHAYAFQLHYLDAYGALFPIDEHEMVEFHRMSQSELMSRLDDALRDTRLAGEMRYIRTMVDLRDHPTVSTSDPDDERLRTLLQTFAVLNSCGARRQTEPDGAHDPIDKDRALKEQYSLFRHKERTAAERARFRRREVDGPESLSDRRRA
jgi:hypothetical protein